MTSSTGPTQSIETLDAGVGANASLEVRDLRLDAIDDAFVASWIGLEANSLEGNAFLYPNFILPSCKYLTTDADPVIIAVENSQSGRLVGLGVIDRRANIVRLLGAGHSDLVFDQRSLGDLVVEHGIDLLATPAVHDPRSDLASVRRSLSSAIDLDAVGRNSDRLLASFWIQIRVSHKHAE